MRDLKNYRMATAEEILYGAYVPAGKAFAVTQIDPDTTWNELFGSLAFLVEVDKPKSEPAEAPELKKKPAVRKTVDAGRICALYKAGWTVKQVADDVKCSEATVVIKLKDAGIYNVPKPAKAMEKGEE